MIVEDLDLPMEYSPDLDRECYELDKKIQSQLKERGKYDSGNRKQKKHTKI